jgi:hypothetical protein
MQIEVKLPTINFTQTPIPVRGPKICLIRQFMNRRLDTVQD